MENIKTINGVIAIIVKDNKVIMGKKKHKPGHFLSDAWHIPGGKGEVGETSEQTAIREMKEELGMNIKILRKLCEYTTRNETLIANSVIFICESIDNPIAGDDLVEARYFDYEEILSLHEKQSFARLPNVVKEFLMSLK
jgi:8-oxo-dGTP diphosphatase